MRASIGQHIQHLLAGLLLIVGPTIAIAFPLIDRVSEFYALLGIDTVALTTLFGAAIALAFALQNLRVRFIFVFGALLLLLYLGQGLIETPLFDEFDSFFLATKYRINTTIFAIGWFCGYGLSRWRFFSVVFAAVLMGITTVALAGIGELRVERLVWMVFPAMLYVFYMLFIKELLYNIRLQDRQHLGKVLLRTILFGGLLVLLYLLSIELLQTTFTQIEDEIAGNAQQEEGTSENSMMEKDSLGNYNLKDYAELKPRLDQSEQLLFCAYVDNFFQPGVPNPLYITLYHLDQYDVEAERFEVSDHTPKKDLYLPVPTSIDMYTTDYDSTVLENDMMEKGNKFIESNIYICELDPQVFVAPSTAFSCQPVTVEKEFRDKYKFSYKVKSEISELNSAYFVYNSRDEELRKFQEMRYKLLEEADDYSDIPQDYIDFYTHMPEGPIFDSIKVLADSITRGAETNIEKVLKVRDYFLYRDEEDVPLYEYTLQPGSPTDPNIPSASLLFNFLFRTHKGYCTYFAGASLFMLRSQGVPVRMATGFATVDRSHKNPGWYWFYADQAHAWNQVYFPEYGWLDFDMTISNEEAANSPSPDGTPPVPPQDADFVGNGIVQRIDTASKNIVVDLHKMIINDNEIPIEGIVQRTIDAGLAKVYQGEEAVVFDSIRLQDSVLVIAFDDKIRRIRAMYENENVDRYLRKLPKIIIAGEIHVPEREKVDTEEEKQKKKAELEESTYGYYLAGGGILLILLTLFGPYLYHLWLLSKIRRAEVVESKAAYSFQHAHFILNQMGIPRENLTPLRYAQEVVDPKFATTMKDFQEAYLKLKYSEERLSDAEIQSIEHFYPEFNQTILTQHTTKQRLFSFLRFDRWMYFLSNLNLIKR